MATDTGTQKLMDVIVIDSTTRDAPTILARLGMLLSFRRSVGIRSVSDMVSQVIKEVSVRGAKMRSLRIIGHGNAIGQYVGEDFLSVSTLPEHSKDLKRLVPHFAPDAVVILAGCQVGQGELLLQRLSHVLDGVRVQAMTANQRPGVRLFFDGDQGGVTTCELTMCSYTGDNSWNRFDAWQANKSR